MAEPGGPQEALAALRAHVQSAHLAAERLAREAGSHDPRPTSGTPSAASGPAPRQGWAQNEAPAAGDGGGELQALVELIGSLRSLLPDELREPVNELLRQVLALLRAVIDWLVLRMEQTEPAAEPQVEDIPVT